MLSYSLNGLLQGYLLPCAAEYFVAEKKYNLYDDERI